jgi:Fe-S oxidoreductase
MVERLVFLALCAASLGYFLQVLWVRLRPIRRARVKLPTDHAARRLGQAFAEVMLQTRVIRERPAAGVLHALVMWGFFAFAWVSLEHLSLGVTGLDSPHTGEGWYGAFAAFWAVAVLIGILGLAFRRFVLRPPVLGKLSVSSTLVAALIAALMVTYLAGWRGIADPLVWKVNWWLHTLAFLGMLWAIPNSKHLHLVLGPVAIVFRSETTSSIRPLREDDDDDLGMLRFGDLSQKDVLDIHACVECGRCTEACPANVIGGTLNPKEIILQLQRGQLAGGDVLAGTTAEVAGGKAWVGEPDLYQCLSCGACEQACPVGIEHVGYKILDMRRGLVSEGRTHSDKLTALFTTMERSPHNPWGVSHDTRRKVIESGKLPIFDGSQQWLLWMGCGGSYDPHGQDVVARETCCGEPARRAGNEYLYLELSQQVIESLRDKKVRRVVTCDPHCTRMLDVDYRQNRAFEELGVEVRHHAEFLAEVLPRLKLRPESKTITYHDPCYLARGRGITAEPREVLRQIGGQLVEMEHHGKRTFCCGAGGGQLFIADDKVELPGGRVNHRRFAEVEASGASTVAVACPYCPIMLKDAAQHAGREDMEVLDLAELVAARLA